MIVPYLTFSFTLLVTSIFLSLASGKGIADVWGELIYNITDERCFIAFKTIWFLLCLFWVRVFYNILLNVNLAGSVSVISFFIGFNLQVYQINVPFFVDSALSVLIFYHFGYFFYKAVSSKVLKSMHPFPTTWLDLVMLLCFFSYIGITVFMHPYVDIKYNVYPIYIVALSMIGIGCLYALALEALEMKSSWSNIVKKVLIYCGKNSLYILGFSSPLIIVMDILLHKVFTNPSSVILVSEFCIVVAISLFVGKTIERYIPILVGKEKQRAN